MSVVLVIGASGFIGRAASTALAERPGTRVVGAGLGVPPVGLPVEWVEVDVLERPPSDLADLLRAIGPSVVVNAAGATVGSMSGLVRSNILTTAVLLEALALADLPMRLIHVGSAAEYGAGVHGSATRESAVATPVGPYGITKLAATQLVATAAGHGRLEAVVLRVFNPIGPAMPPSSLPGAALQRLLAARDSRSDEVTFGPLGAVRDFVDIRDVAAAVVAASLAPSTPSPIVNVGSGTPRAAREVVEALARRLGFSGRIAETLAGSSRSADVLWQVADVALARREFGWAPVHDLESSVDLVVSDSGG